MDDWRKWVIVVAGVVAGVGQFWGSIYYLPLVGGAVAAVVALSISLLAIYGINKGGVDYEGFISGLGIDEGILGIIIPLILIAGIIYLFYKLKSNTFLVLGILFILTSLTELVYEKSSIFWMGVGLIALWLLWKLIK